MSKSSKSKKERIPRMTEEQYAEYVTALKGETPLKGCGETAERHRDTPHIDAARRGER